MKRMLCLIGESGSGKTTIAKHLELLGYKVLPSFTTRPKRSHDEIHHTFLTAKQFDEIKKDLVAHTTFNGYEYGATKQQIELFDIYVIDLPGLFSLIENVGRDCYYAAYLSVSEFAREKRMSETRGAASAKERILHDRKAFADMPKNMIDLVLENETPMQLETNILKLHDILHKFKKDHFD